VIDAGLIADFLDVEDDVVGVFLDAVVDGGFEIGLGAVVVDAQAAADVDELEAGPETLHFDVDAGELDDGILDVADVVDLAAEVEVEQVEAVAHVIAAEVFEGFHDLGDEEAELGADAAGLFPAACAFGREFHPDADGGLDVVELGVLDDELELAEFFDDGDDVLADLGGEDDGFDEFIVLEAVADDGGLVVADQGHDREELGLGAGFDAKAIFAAEVEDLLDDVALLIDFDGIDAAIEALVVVLADGVGKGLVDAGDAVFEDVGEADEHGGLDVALAELVDEFFQVDLAVFVGVRVDGDGAFGGDGEVALAPVVDAVGSGGIGGGPRGGRRRLGDGGGDRRAVSRAVMPVGRKRLHGGSHRVARDRYVSAHFF
jgi:hypothetical protein